MPRQRQRRVREFTVTHAQSLTQPFPNRKPRPSVERGIYSASTQDVSIPQNFSNHGKNATLDVRRSMFGISEGPSPTLNFELAVRRALTPPTHPATPSGAIPVPHIFSDIAAADTGKCTK
jgi:hypothetical protein